MNARELQTAVTKDLESLFSENRFKTASRTMEPIRAYAQALPRFDAQVDDGFFPYIIVRVEGGGVESQAAPHKVDIMIIVGIYDDGTEVYAGEKENRKPGEHPSFADADGWDTRNLGTVAVMEVLEKIQAHYELEPSIENGKFYFDGPFHWAMQDEDSYPYYFGVCEMSFTLAAPRKKESQFV